MLRLSNVFWETYILFSKVCRVLFISFLIDLKIRSVIKELAFDLSYNLRSHSFKPSSSSANKNNMIYKY
jgi:hypothetical protein